SNYRFYVQTRQFIPVEKTAVRNWSHKKTGELILAEMHLNEAAKVQEKALAAKYMKAKFSRGALKSKQLNMAINKVANEQVSKHHTDNRILGMKSNDVWAYGDLVLVVEVRGSRGVHTIRVSLLKNKILCTSHTEFPQSEAFHTVKANIFPMY